MEPGAKRWPRRMIRTRRTRDLRFRGFRASVALVALAVNVGWRSPCAAQQSGSAAAQVLFEEARQLMSAGHYAEACPKLEESQRIDPGSGTLMNLADCYERTGRIASAWGAFLDAEAGARLVGNTARAGRTRTLSGPRAALTADRLPGRRAPRRAGDPARRSAGRLPAMGHADPDRSRRPLDRRHGARSRTVDHADQRARARRPSRW